MLCLAASAKIGKKAMKISVTVVHRVANPLQPQKMNTMAEIDMICFTLQSNCYFLSGM